MKPFVVCLWLAALPTLSAGAPTITGLAMNPIDAGGQFPFTLNISGTGFKPNARVFWGSTILPSWPAADGSLQATVTPDLRWLSDNYPITVVNSDGVASNAYPEVVRPVLLTVTPAFLVAGSAQTIKLGGFGFQSGIQAQLTSAAGSMMLPTTLVDGETLTVAIPASMLTSTQTALVRLINVKADPTGGNASADSRTFEIRTGPSISSAGMNPIDAGGGGFMLNVNGTGFAPGAVVNWGKMALVTTFLNPTLLQAAVGPELRTLAGA